MRRGIIALTELLIICGILGLIGIGVAVSVHKAAPPATYAPNVMVTWNRGGTWIRERARFDWRAGSACSFTLPDGTRITTATATFEWRLDP